MAENKTCIKPGMTVLDIVSKYRATIEIFERYDKRARECICCSALFDPLEDVAEKYNLDLIELLRDLETAVRSDK